MSQEALTTASIITGWIYFFAWSLSFYGQFYTNWKLKNVEGFKLDFQLLNFTGFAFYSFMYIVGFFWSDSNPYDNYGLGKVEIQDLLFAVHAFTLTCLTGIQCLKYPRGKNKVSKTTWILFAFYWYTAVVLYFTMMVANWIPSSENFNFIMLLGYYKLSISVIKYVPQAYWNFKRKSTEGWSIVNILLDLTGGVFSIAQTIIDVINGDSEKINPIKVGLGNIAIVFDIIFIVQHYILYRSASKKNQEKADSSEENKQSLLNDYEQGRQIRACPAITNN